MTVAILRADSRGLLASRGAHRPAPGWGGIRSFGCAILVVTLLGVAIMLAGLATVVGLVCIYDVLARQGWLPKLAGPYRPRRVA